jgi:hypothetical protein
MEQRLVKVCGPLANAASDAAMARSRKVTCLIDRNIARNVPLKVAVVSQNVGLAQNRVANSPFIPTHYEEANAGHISSIRQAARSFRC